MLDSLATMAHIVLFPVPGAPVTTTILPDCTGLSPFPPAALPPGSVHFITTAGGGKPPAWPLAFRPAGQRDILTYIQFKKHDKIALQRVVPANVNPVVRTLAFFFERG